MNRLLKLLQDGRFHSGQELGDALGISRSAVWKHLQRLQGETSLLLYKVPGRGYRLAEPLSLLNSEELAPQLMRLGWTLHLFDAIDSTNAEALRLLQQERTPFLVMAEAQTSGRGRRGRRWVSPFGQNLYCSLAFKVHGGARQLSGMSLAVGLAVMHALRLAGVPQVGLKWPNDVYVDGRKIAGILLELTGDPADVCHVVVGIGINVNMIDAEGIDQRWTSMKEHIGMVDRNALVVTLASALKRYLEQHANLGFSSLKDEWEASHIWQGQKCTLSTGAHDFSGVVVGVDHQGGLRLMIEGDERVFNGGELSLRLDR
ncbi:bifunctional biotin--[acetyl-CoA-carboxylase] ligase/biotin operon repressor BirA [Pseudomonas songnenensis]|jgi:BirA family biotin operon repressor/biotin-[acetyl-CoA-carboxylase] ligase|uniref:Bifunctional ligase/repressor BirA n=1 Tax=Pseudomonas songnenensis TaxID=1176259 RepID=A0ABX9UMY4_9PSED|nr:bifunctional biotin--[acetyl-CoA-carboxylase] ligase/biotin operon repressor BirA [Pseudomonas songnenensis]MCQ4301669.1 bifunctional biotin--[acetyl-CoA-carboxylase] ligase/biotin operon repressor BirA [Pseudomonas songnenensis]RMH93262.1 bifunctional biotin--[acetyl-CoA-carboxylase] ligase/biotin operon repressor BirA [Pseudomonas songnenensis]